MPPGCTRRKLSTGFVDGAWLHEVGQDVSANMRTRQLRGFRDAGGWDADPRHAAHHWRVAAHSGGTKEPLRAAQSGIRLNVPRREHGSSDDPPRRTTR